MRPLLTVGLMLLLMSSSAPAGQAWHSRARHTILAHTGEVADCYLPIATRVPGLAGTIEVQWTLSKDGVPIGTAILEDTLADKRVAACVKKRARKWRFPAPGRVAVISYPFHLRTS